MHCVGIRLGDRLVVDKPPSVDEVRAKVVIRGQEFFVPEHYPKDAFGKLEYDKNLIKELDTKTTGVLRNMCKHGPPAAQPTYKDKKADLIYKPHICIYIYDIKAPSFLEPHFVCADLAIHGLARVGRHLHKWPGIHQGAICP